MWERSSAYSIWRGGGTAGKRPLGRPKCRWEDNKKIYINELGWEGMDWTHVAQERNKWRAVVNEVMNLQVA
jgi:hypothetical protein